MKKVLIANRGEIAVRIIKTCREMGLATVAIASEADQHSVHAQAADTWVPVGPSPANESYLVIENVLEAAKSSGADAIHPGFGFLSENAGFARAVKEAGLIFIGPEPETIAAMGSKKASKEIMAQAGVPLVPGYHGSDQSESSLKAEAEKIGYPVLIKASAGGGGKGMRVVERGEDFSAALSTARREALGAFGDDTVLLEKYLMRPRHIEFQVFGDNHGNRVHLFERECSIQRRHQKIIEETPSPALTPELRQAMAEAALKAANAVNYTSAGTVEFMLDEGGAFYFLEMNTRLQVEHPITEMLTGLDLVRWQIMVAAGEPLPLRQEDIQARGHSLEVRVYAEDPDHQFLPQTGRIVGYWEPRGLGVRVDSGVQMGDEVSIYYDPMLAKLITWGPDREISRQKMLVALSNYAIHGVRTNITYLRSLLEHPAFIAGDTPTSFISQHGSDLLPKHAYLQQAMALSHLTGHADSSRPPSESPHVIDVWDSLRGWRSLA